MISIPGYLVGTPLTSEQMIPEEPAYLDNHGSVFHSLLPAQSQRPDTGYACNMAVSNQFTAESPETYRDNPI